MRLDVAVIALSLLTSASAAAIGEPLNIAHVDVEEHDLFKRKGGGGGGGRGGGSSSSGGRGGGSSSSGSSGSGSSGSGSSSSGSSGGRGGSSGSGSSGSGSSGSSGNRGGSGSSGSSGNRGSSGNTGNRGPSNTGAGVNTGGTTKSGSGTQPRFGGGQYYGGGARVPYRAGSNSRSGIVPGLIAGTALFALWPGLWLGGAYLYNYHNPYHFHNASNNNKEEELPVICGCAQGAECGCDESGNTTNIDELVGNGSYAHLNKTMVTVGTKDGQKVLLINGTLENGTTVKGDSDTDPDGKSTADTSDTNASGAVKTALQTMGFWPVVATVAAIVLVA